MLRKQAGMSFPVLVGLLALLVFAVVTGFKVIQVYVQYFSIKHALNDTAKENPNAPTSVIRAAFYRKATVEYFTAVRESDIDVDKDDNGNDILSVKYQQTVPLVANVSLLFDFSITTQPTAESKE